MTTQKNPASGRNGASGFRRSSARSVRIGTVAGAPSLSTNNNNPNSGYTQGPGSPGTDGASAGGGAANLPMLTSEQVAQQVALLNQLNQSYAQTFSRIADLYGGLATASDAAVDAFIRGNENLGVAMKKATVEILSSIAKRAVVEAAWNYAQAIAAAATLDPVGAAAHAAAATEYLAVASLAGGAGRAVASSIPASAGRAGSARAASSGGGGGGLTPRYAGGGNGGGGAGRGGANGTAREPVTININVSGPIDERTLADAMRRGMEAYNRYYR